MAFAGERYYNIYRILLSILGLWPYQNPLAIQRAFFFGVLIFCVSFQLMIFLTRTCNFELVMKELSYILPCLAGFSSYQFFYFHPGVIKRLFEHIKEDWHTMTNDNEIKILEKYAFETYVLTLFLTVIASILGAGITILECIPPMLDVVAPMNKSRPRKLKMDFELFIDERQHFYIYLIFEVVMVLVASFTLTATGSLLIAFLTHCCATYKIASMLAEDIVNNDTLQVPAHQKIFVMYERISRAVRVHRSSLQFFKDFLDSANIWFFTLTAIAVLSLTCNLFRFYHATQMKELPEMLMCFLMVSGHFFVIFVSNFMGQLITDHSSEVFNSAYRTMWYLAPLPIQKLVLIMMQHTLKPDIMLIGGIFVGSLEGFSTLTTTSISYFTVIYNMN